MLEKAGNYCNHLDLFSLRNMQEFSRKNLERSIWNKLEKARIN